jgi:hypothetical protein
MRPLFSNTATAQVETCEDKIVYLDTVRLDGLGLEVGPVSKTN